MSEVETV